MMFLRHHQDRRLIAAMTRIRSGQARGGMMGRLTVLRGKIGHAFWSLVSGSDIARDATIAADTRFPHLNGVVIHEDAVIEPGCLIMQQVTLGQLAGPGAPHVGRGAYVGAGAKVLGPVRIGAGARIGANAVVLEDVPPNATAVGVPARIIPPTGEA